jgi:rod shape-determining protein MreC
MQVRTRTWFSAVVAAGIVFIIASQIGFFDPVENVTLNATKPVESALRDVTRPAADFVTNITDVDRLTDENQDLREQNETLLTELARLREAEAENQRFRQLLEIRQERPGDSFVDAEVFASDPNNVGDSIAIDRGARDGIEEGMIVLTQQGSLVGRVERALDDVAWVTLITDPSSAVGALIQGSRAQGVVAGSIDGSLEMEFVEGTANVREGDLVLTSGIGGSYPRGEVIGRVVNVESSAQELFQNVEVEPVADLSQLESVLVLTSFVPREEAAE